MSLDAKWVPMKWPCGPLGGTQSDKSSGTNADLRETLAGWGRPAALELLKGSPINCLVVDWASGAAEDSAQQQALKPLIEAGRQIGLSFVGKVAAKDHQEAVVAAGAAAGLSAVILENPHESSLSLPVIRQFPRDKVEWEATTPIFSSTENVWPGVNLETMRGDTAMAGPTGVPWVNSNGWFSLLIPKPIAWRWPTAARMAAGGSSHWTIRLGRQS
jgi:hypothetical protein